MSVLSAEDLYLFAEGTHYRLYEKLGAHVRPEGVDFAVWAPAAESVCVNAGFQAPLARNAAGIWEGFVPGLREGARYTYQVTSRHAAREKADPFAFATEQPGTASVVAGLDFAWGDGDWMQSRRTLNALDRPISTYEMHLGSWRRVPEEGGRLLTYRELAARLPDYLTEMGYTHVELLPVMEHPYYGSWGYQVTGYFAPTSRYGGPREFMELVDALHRRGIGVILDWVPSHFATDEHGLGAFDGTALFEYAPELGISSQWDSYVFDWGKPEVRSFLLSSAVFWLDRYHVDGLRVDGVAAMLYRDAAHKHENPDAVAFLRQFTEVVRRYYPDVLTIAEDSSARPKVSRPVGEGGLGFDLKWDMGWMHDTLEYLAAPPSERPAHHGNLTFRSVYQFNENYVLPLSHDEVKPPFGSLVAKMPDDEWRKFAGLRLLLSYQFAEPGKKLLFMGGEFAQWNEWRHDLSLDWHLLQDTRHAGMRNLAGTLNWIYKSEPALHQFDCDPAGFEWIAGDDAGRGILCFLRKGREGSRPVVVVCNFQPVPRFNYRVGVPTGGWWGEVFNSDSVRYGGAGYGNMGGAEAAPIPWHGRPQSLNLTVPPLAALFLRSP